MQHTHDPLRSPCTTCQGRRFYVFPEWRIGPATNQAAVPVAVCIDANPGGFTVQYESVPMYLRVCVQCGGAQMFVDPAAVHALAQRHHAPFHYVDATPPPAVTPDPHRR